MNRTIYQGRSNSFAFLIILFLYNIIRILIRYIINYRYNLSSYLSGWILLFGIIGITWGGYKITAWIQCICNCPLSYVIVTGKRQYTTNADIHQIIVNLDSLGTFATQDINVIQKNIERFPWIQHVSIRKQWPDTLKINVVEHIPLAYWNGSQKTMSVTGTVFSIPITATDVHQEHDNRYLMPILYGPEGSERDVLINYYIFNKILKSSQFDIKVAKMDERYSWQLILKQNNIHLKLGNKNVIERLCCFIKIYPVLLQKIYENNQYIDYIDFRYHSGCAIRWMPHTITPIFYNK